MDVLTDDAFTRLFALAETDLERIKLAIREGRFTIWTRNDKPNFSEEYLSPILSLPKGQLVKRKKRKTGGEGLNYVMELKYSYQNMGKKIRVYMKGFFSKSGHLILGLEIQSLRKDRRK